MYCTISSFIISDFISLRSWVMMCAFRRLKFQGSAHANIHTICFSSFFKNLLLKLKSRFVRVVCCYCSWAADDIGCLQLASYTQRPFIIVSMRSPCPPSRPADVGYAYLNIYEYKILFFFSFLLCSFHRLTSSSTWEREKERDEEEKSRRSRLTWM